MVKFGDYIVTIDEISYIRKVGAGCDIMLKNGKMLRISTVSDEEWNTFNDMLMHLNKMTEGK
jgi:hypothetical protein